MAGVLGTRYVCAVRDFFRKHRKAAALLVGAVVLLACGALLLAWEMQYECVRWTSGISVSKHGVVSKTKACAETRPRWGENVGK